MLPTCFLRQEQHGLIAADRPRGIQKALKDWLVGFGLLYGFVNIKKNIEYGRPHPLKSAFSIPHSSLKSNLIW